MPNRRKSTQVIRVILHDARHDSIALPTRTFAAGFQTSPMVEFNEVFKYGTRCVFGVPPTRGGHPKTSWSGQAPTPPNEVSYLMSRSESRKTDDRIQVRCSTEVKAKLTEKAHEAGLSLSQYLIKSGLGKRIQSKGNYNALAALVKITALQKHLFNEGAGVHSKEYSEILIEVKKAAQKLQQEMDGDT